MNKIDVYGSNETNAKSKSVTLYKGDGGDVGIEKPCNNANWIKVASLTFATENNMQFDRNNKVTFYPEASSICWKLKVEGFTETLCGYDGKNAYDTEPPTVNCYDQYQVGLDEISFENFDWSGIAGPGEQSSSPEKGADFSKPAYDPTNGER